MLYLLDLIPVFAFSLVILLGVRRAVLNRDQPTLKVAIALFILGVFFDLLSTYVFGVVCGIDNFYKFEANKLAVACVQDYGLVLGLVLSVLHPRHFMNIAIVLSIVGIAIRFFLILTSFRPVYFRTCIAWGIIFLAIMRLGASVNNVFAIIAVQSSL
ncbi:hypothetical protein HY967_03850 [Candidatus Jorgensenbacteria bacterium]|nr:hypothetical protein [Candidatus Jorgensenbacteria bacterium]